MSLKVLLVLAFTSLAMSAPFVPIEEGFHQPQPYAFGYSVKDKHGEQHRQETGDGAGGVKGSYGFTDDRGVHRQVEYVADKAGYRAEVKTNEHGTAAQDPAAVKMVSSAHPYFGGKGVLGAGLLHGLAGSAIAGKALAGVGGPGLYGAGLAAESAAVGVPIVGYGAGVGLGAAGFSAYAEPLLGGAIKGYDSRFGAY